MFSRPLAFVLGTGLALIAANAGAQPSPARTAAPSAPAAPAARSTTAAPSAAAALAVTPGVGIGALRLGMDRRDVEAANVAPGVRLGTARFVHAGTYDLTFDEQGALARIAVELPNAAGGLRVGTRTVASRGTVAELLAAAQPCTPLDLREGASVATCANGGGLEVASAGPRSIPTAIVYRAASAAPAASPAAGPSALLELAPLPERPAGVPRQRVQLVYRASAGGAATTRDLGEAMGTCREVQPAEGGALLVVRCFFAETGTEYRLEREPGALIVRRRALNEGAGTRGPARVVTRLAVSTAAVPSAAQLATRGPAAAH